MERVSREDYDKVLFDPNLVVVQNQEYISKMEYIERLIVGGKERYRLVITASGSSYYRV